MENQTLYIFVLIIPSVLSIIAIILLLYYMYNAKEQKRKRKQKFIDFYYAMKMQKELCLTPRTKAEQSLESAEQAWDNLMKIESGVFKKNK